MRPALRLIMMMMMMMMSLTLAEAADAGRPFEDGLAAFARQDYATALRLWRPLADQGDARAQNELGTMYDNGLGVPKNYAEAMNWFRKAADQGDASAQYALGLAYEGGLGVPQNYAEAAKWLDSP